MENLQNKEKDIATLILDTSNLVRELRNKIMALQELDINEDELIRLIFKSIMFEKDAEVELAENCASIVSDCLGADYKCNIESILMNTYSNDVTGITNATYSCGCEIIKELRRIRAYQNGYLFFQFLQMLDRDVVLVKFTPPPMPV